MMTKTTEKKAKVHTVYSRKGGVGKTDFALNMAYALALIGYKVVVLDLDPSGDTTSIIMNNMEKSDPNFIKERTDYYTNENPDNPQFLNGFLALRDYKDLSTEFTYDISDVIDYKIDKNNFKEVTIHDAIQKTRIDNLDFVPCRQKLELTATRLKESGKIYTLRQILKEIQTEYDFIIIDCQPVKNYLTFNVIHATNQDGDYVMIPFKNSRGGIEALEETIKMLMSVIEDDASWDGDFKVINTMYNRNKNDYEMDENLRYALGDKVLHTKIRYQAKPVVNASLNGKILLESTKPSNIDNIENIKWKYGVSEDYWNVANEIVNLAFPDSNHIE